MSGDRTYTPGWVVDDMIRHFQPSGSVLDPCRGNGEFSDKLGCDWCEIDEGKDFLAYAGSVDWIISNPPYSKLNKFTRKAMQVADNVVWLVPVWKMMQAYGLVRAIYDFGGLEHIRWYGTGGSLGFPMGNGIGAVHISRKAGLETSTSFFNPPKAANPEVSK